MDIAGPVDAPAPRPAVLLFHGGGWRYGSRGDERPMAAFLASLGYVAATASYRLTADGSTYPAQVQDAYAALRFLRSRSADFQIDRGRIAVGGQSAGGELALLLGLAEDPAVFKESYCEPVQVVFSIYGPTDLVALHRPGSLVSKLLLVPYLGGTPDECPSRWREASPVHHARRGAPPTLLVHGDSDDVVPFEQAVMLERRLRQVGASVRLVRVPGGPHGWGGDFNGRVCQSTLPAIAHFLAEHLHPPERDGS